MRVASMFSPNSQPENDKDKWHGYLSSFLQMSLSCHFCLNPSVLQIAVACVNSWEQLGLQQFGACVKTWAWGPWGFAREDQCNPPADPCVPLHLEGLKWHVMNDFAEPEIFMHELQLYVGLSLLKAPFDWKAARGAITYFFQQAPGNQGGFISFFSVLLLDVLIVFKLVQWNKYCANVFKSKEQFVLEKMKNKKYFVVVVGPDPSSCPWSLPFY